jgi:hypothetical protein
VSPDEVEELRGVQRLLRKSIPCEVVEEFLPDPDREPAPLARPRGGRAHLDRPQRPWSRPGASSTTSTYSRTNLSAAAGSR